MRNQLLYLKQKGQKFECMSRFANNLYRVMSCSPDEFAAKKYNKFMKLKERELNHQISQQNQELTNETKTKIRDLKYFDGFNKQIDDDLRKHYSYLIPSKIIIETSEKLMAQNKLEKKKSARRCKHDQH